MDLIVSPSGQAKAIYDEMIELTTLGSIQIRRASHVEPNLEGRWAADLAPVGGPVLGPFRHRSAALAAETAWLHAHWLIPSE